MTTNNFSTPQQIAIAFAGVPAGCLSFLASGTIVIMISRSPTRFGNPFRRLIFSISFYDCIQSLTLIIATFLSPSGVTWGAIGNDSTCTFIGFLFQLSSIGSPMYSFVLSLFYLCAIKSNMRNEVFTKRFEIPCHVGINLLAWSSSIYLAFGGYMNPSDSSVCWISSYPNGCVHNDEIECERGENAFLMRWLFTGGPILICTIGLVSILVILIRSMFTLQKKMNKLKYGWMRSSNNPPVEENIMQKLSRRFSSSSTSVHHPTMQNNDEQVGEGTSAPFRPGRTPSTSNLARHPDRFKKKRSNSNRSNWTEDDELDNLLKQAILYASAFLLIYMFPYIYHIIEQINGSGPFPMLLLGRIFGPMQGVLNIIIYTRVKVSSLRSGSNYSWLGAFWVVISSGADPEVIMFRKSQNEEVTRDVGQHENAEAGTMKKFMRRSDKKKRRSSVTFQNEDMSNRVDEIDVEAINNCVSENSPTIKTNEQINREYLEHQLDDSSESSAARHSPIETIDDDKEVEGVIGLDSKPDFAIEESVVDEVLNSMSDNEVERIESIEIESSSHHCSQKNAHGNLQNHHESESK